ncbi:MAG TPA: DUF6352 family protein [Geminicoccaceae bacterium]
MPDFWRSSGYRLLTCDPSGRLRASDDFLRAFWLRPEVTPVPESCAEELALHEALMAEPRMAVPPERLARLADPDARDNYAAVLRLRERLLAWPTMEAAYLDLVRTGLSGVPPLFLDQLAHVFLRHLLAGCDDPIRLRAAELLFREQKVTIQDGAIMLADEETVEMRTSGAGRGRLLLEDEAPAKRVDLDVLDEANAAIYWARSDRFDTVLDLSFASPGLDALCRVLEAWVRHFTGAAVSIQPLQRIDDQRWVWHVGLDSEASALLNDLYDGEEIEKARRARLLALFRLEFRDPADMLERVRGRPVYLGLAMTGAQRLKLKPHNLLINLPLARAA